MDGDMAARHLGVVALVTKQQSNARLWAGQQGIDETFFFLKRI